jgi:ribosomal protein S18 acetylase RimI-like enzyme
MRRGCAQPPWRRVQSDRLSASSTHCAIRQATVDDAPQIARVHCESWRSTYPGLIPQHVIDDWANLEVRTKQWTETLVAAKSPVWVHEQSGVIVGFSSAGSAKPATDGLTGQLFALYLMQSAHRQGIGQALTQTALHYLQTIGHTRVRVEMMKDNWPAIRFYERMGATFREEAQFEMSGVALTELVYGWDDTTPR